MIKKIKLKLEHLTKAYDMVVSQPYPGPEDKDLLLTEIGQRIMKKAAIEAEFQKHKQILLKLETGEIDQYQAFVMLPNINEVEKNETPEEIAIKQWAKHKIEREQQ